MEILFWNLAQVKTVMQLKSFTKCASFHGIEISNKASFSWKVYFDIEGFFDFRHNIYTVC